MGRNEKELVLINKTGSTTGKSTNTVPITNKQITEAGYDPEETLKVKRVPEPEKGEIRLQIQKEEE